MKYSKFTWTTWLVFKIFIKLTTYSMLKARNMEEEANQWISDWGPIANPFIDYVFFPILHVFTFINYHMELFTDDIIDDYLFPLYGFLKPFLDFLRDSCVKLLLFNISVYETMICVDLGTLVFILLFLYACADIVCFYWKMKMVKIYEKVKKDIEIEYGQEEGLIHNEKRFEIFYLYNLLVVLYSNIDLNTVENVS